MNTCENRLDTCRRRGLVRALARAGAKPRRKLALNPSACVESARAGAKPRQKLALNPLACVESARAGATPLTHAWRVHARFTQLEVFAFSHTHAQTNAHSHTTTQQHHHTATQPHSRTAAYTYIHTYIHKYTQTDVAYQVDGSSRRQTECRPFASGSW